VKPKVYLETTIPSLLVARPSRVLRVVNDQQVTREWWEARRGKFQLFVSELVLEEVVRGDRALAAQRLAAIAGCPILEATGAAKSLTLELLDSGLIPTKAAADAAHIAVAAVQGMDFLLTWNCRHIANAMTVDRVRDLCARRGFPAPVICTPYELMLS
jgi:hypothetical protein